MCLKCHADLAVVCTQIISVVFWNELFEALAMSLGLNTPLIDEVFAG